MTERRARAQRRQAAGFLLVGVANLQETHSVALETLLAREGEVLTKKERKALTYALQWHRKVVRYVRAVGKHLQGESAKEEARKAVMWNAEDEGQAE